VSQMRNILDYGLSKKKKEKTLLILTISFPQKAFLGFWFYFHEFLTYMCRKISIAILSEFCFCPIWASRTPFSTTISILDSNFFHFWGCLCLRLIIIITSKKKLHPLFVLCLVISWNYCQKFGKEYQYDSAFAESSFFFFFSFLP
jgi:hypothetical protein